MKRPSIDNLNRFMRGDKLTTPQRANALIEFKKLGYYIDSLEASLAKDGEELTFLHKENQQRSKAMKALINDILIKMQSGDMCIGEASYRLLKLKLSDVTNSKTEQLISPFKVRIELREKQFDHEAHRGFCTIKGQPRIVESRIVEWYCTSWEEAVNSFNPNEVEWVTINEGSIHIDRC